MVRVSQKGCFVTRAGVGMSTTSLGQNGSPRPNLPLTTSTPTQLALDILGAEENIDACRIELLERLVFPRVSTCQKPFHSHRKILCRYTAHKVLKIIWKESSFISNTDLMMLGINKVFNSNGITVHGLAVKFAGQQPSLVSKLNSQIRTIVLASESFDLVKRQNSTKQSILATDLLNEFMIELARAQQKYIKTGTSLGSE